MSTPIYAVNYIFNKHFILSLVLFITHGIWTNIQVTLQIKFYVYLSIHSLFCVLNFMLPACRTNISQAELNPCRSKIFCSILKCSLNSVNLIVALNDRKLDIIKAN